MDVAIKDIRVPEGRRALDPAKVAEIAASIKLLGLLAPIGVRRHGDAPVELVWGGHRLAACLSLGMKTIAAIAVDGLGWDQGHRENADLDDFVKMTELAENLHRSELTTSQRDEFLAEWVALVEKRGPQLGGGRQVPKKKPGPKPSPAMAEVAKTSGIGLKTVKEAVAKSKVSPEVKAAADHAGLSHKQRLAISRLPEADQLAGVSKQAAINIVVDRTEQTAAAKSKPQLADAGTPADAVKAFRESLPTKAEANKIALKLEAETGATHAVLGKDGKYHSGATEAEREAGDAYLRMSGALRAVAALNMTAADAIASVSRQSKPFFPKLLGDVQRIIVEFRTEWEKVHGVEGADRAEADDPLALPEFLKRTAS
jgi:hypothetical protein